MAGRRWPKVMIYLGLQRLEVGEANTEGRQKVMTGSKVVFCFGIDKRIKKQEEG